MIERPMLAATWTEEIAEHFDTHGRWPVLASPKLDGIRALVINGELVSRNFKPIPNGSTFRRFSHPELEGLDGELIVGPANTCDAFRRTSSGIMSEAGDPEATFYVFDDFRCSLAFEHRIQKLRERVTKIKFAHIGDRIKVVPHMPLYNADELRVYEETTLEAGYEGVMLRDPKGPYKEGRSTGREGWLLKVKRFCDSEAVVIAAHPLEENHNTQTRDELGRSKRSSHKAGKVAVAKLGKLLVRDLTTGAEFGIGTGFTEEQRVELWKNAASLVTRIVKYKYFPSGSKDAPRFPVFIGFRDRRDM